MEIESDRAAHIGDPSAKEDTSNSAGDDARAVYAAYTQSIASGSRPTVENRLKRAAEVLGVDPQSYSWYEMSLEDLARVRDGLIERSWSASTIDATLSAIRGLCKTSYSEEILGKPYWECEEGHRRYDHAQSLKTIKAPDREGSDPVGRPLGPNEFETLLNACLADRTTVGARDAAIIMTCYLGGLGTPELAEIEFEDIMPDARVIAFGRLKKSNVRSVVLGARAALVLANWISLRGNRPGKLFLPLNRFGMPDGDKMSVMAIHWVLKSRSRQAMLKPVTVRDLRQTVIRDLLAAGATYATLTFIMGRNLALSRYDTRSPEQAEKDLSDKVITPYHRVESQLFYIPKIVLGRASEL